MKLFLDISHYEAVTDWVKVKEQCEGIYLKSTQRTNWKDATFNSYRAGCERVGLPWGAYHFYEATCTGVAQADFLLSVLNGNYGQFPPCLDYEPKYINQFPPRTGALASIKMFFDTIEQRTGIKPIFYSNMDHINDLKPIPDWLLDHELWIASYSAKEPVTPWSRWAMWQFSDAGSIDGIEDAVDVNYVQDDFMGNVTQPELTLEEKVDWLWEQHHPT